MKITIASDIHLEFYKSKHLIKNLVQKCFTTPTDLLILAGDISTSKEKDAWKFPYFLTLVESSYYKVITVPGNHDFYGVDPSYRLNHLVSNTSLFHTHLNRQTFRYQGLHIAGCNAWYEAAEPLADMSEIPDAVSFTKAQRWADFYFLESMSSEEIDILITHVPLSPQAIHPKYANDPLNKFFFHDKENLIKAINPFLCISGHTHEASEYWIGSTRYIIHPLGYPNKIKPFWQPVILEILC